MLCLNSGCCFAGKQHSSQRQQCCCAGGLAGAVQATATAGQAARPARRGEGCRPPCPQSSCTPNPYPSSQTGKPLRSRLLPARAGDGLSGPQQMQTLCQIRKPCTRPGQQPMQSRRRREDATAGPPSRAAGEGPGVMPPWGRTQTLKMCAASALSHHAARTKARALDLSFQGSARAGTHPGTPPQV